DYYCMIWHNTLWVF
nr:immunoglobulin light chain junction region [Macaca mulatta]